MFNIKKMLKQCALVLVNSRHLVPRLFFAVCTFSALHLRVNVRIVSILFVFLLLFSRILLLYDIIVLRKNMPFMLK